MTQKKEHLFLLKSQSSFINRAIKNVFFSSFGTLANVVINFLFAGITVRYLGVDRSGFFMALSALTGLNTFLGDFGLSTPAMRRVSSLRSEGDYSTARSVIGSVTTTNLVSNLIIVLLIILFYDQIYSWTKLDIAYYNEAHLATLLTLIGYTVFQATNSWRSMYLALERYDISSALNIIFGILNGLVGLIVLVKFPDMAVLSTARLTIILLHAFVDAMVLRKLFRGFILPAWNWREIKRLFNFGVWVYVQSISALLIGRLNSLILTSYLGSSVLPLYEFPQRIYKQIHSFLASQFHFIFPMFSSYKEKSEGELSIKEDQLRWILAIFSAFIYSGVGLAGSALLEKMVDIEFANLAKVPLYLACLQGFFQAQNIVPHYFSWAFGHAKPNSISGIVQGVIVSLSAIILIPRFGYIGASIAQLWVIMIVIFQIGWIYGLLFQQPIKLDYILTYIPAIFLVIVSVFTFNIISSVYPSSGIVQIIITIVSCIVGFLFSLFIEYLLFRKKQRIKVLKRIIISIITMLKSKKNYKKYIS